MRISGQIKGGTGQGKPMKRTVPGSRLLAAGLLAAAFVGVGRLQAQSVSNSLQNGGFEGTYTAYQNDQTRMIAPGWTPWNLPPGPNDPSYVNQTPVYRVAAYASRIHSGTAAQEYFTFYATHNAGLYQQIAVTTGSHLHFSAFLSVWSGDGDDPTHSVNPGGVSVQVGIDPAGGTDSTASGIVWSTAQEFYDQYKQLVIDATASGSKITVFIRSQVQQPVKNNHVFVDDAALTIQTAATSTSVATTPAAALTHTPLPSTTPVPVTHTPVPTTAPQTPTHSVLFPSPTREGTVLPTTTPGGPTFTLPAPLTATSVSTIAPTDSGTTVPTEVTTAVFTSTPNTTPISSVTYIVQAGDTVSALAVRFNSTVDAIIAANNLNSDALIFVGEQLTIPVFQPIELTATMVPVTATAIFVPPPTSTYVPPGLGGPTVNGIGTYIVQPGETLASIAARYGTSALALARLNGIINPQLIRIGQVLAVPGPGNNNNGQAPTYPTAVPSRTYTVRVGDTLFSIAAHFGVTVTALVNANNIPNANLVYVGQILAIP